MVFVPGEEFGSSAKKWVMEGVDQNFKIKFEGQFLAENMTEKIGNNLGETSTVGKSKPDFQWLSGQKETFSFNTKMFARNSLVSIKQDVQLLKTFTRRDKGLKRQPRVLFTAGTEIGFICFINEVEFAYDELRDDGALRGALLRLTLQVLDETVTEAAATSLRAQISFAAGAIQAGAALFSQSAKGIINIPGGSLHTIGRKHDVRQGDTFESIAKSEYGNALLGDILRRAQPQREPLQAGDRVILVERTDIITIPVTQQSVALKNSKTNLELRKEKLAARNRKRTIFI